MSKKDFIKITKKEKCVICDIETHKDQMHNSEPVRKGKCCEDCNYLHVIPSRIEILNIKY
jgi:hypothetical protein|tara:strand:- start:2095 stop:2274 length:180 start_codon:yes stop_codon:yes gene_type:complete